MKRFRCEVPIKFFSSQSLFLDDRMGLSRLSSTTGLMGYLAMLIMICVLYIVIEGHSRDAKSIEFDSKITDALSNFGLGIGGVKTFEYSVSPFYHIECQSLIKIIQMASNG